MELSRKELYEIGERIARRLWSEIPAEAGFFGRAYQDIEKDEGEGEIIYRIPLSFTVPGILIGLVNLEDVNIEGETAKLGYHIICRIGD